MVIPEVVEARLNNLAAMKFKIEAVIKHHTWVSDRMPYMFGQCSKKITGVNVPYVPRLILLADTSRSRWVGDIIHN